MELTLNSIDGSAGKVSVSEQLFGADFNEALIHQVVVAYLAGGRSGTKSQKNRAAVSGGGRKPWSQKGSGRARAGTIRSPIWRSGGVTFAASPRDHSVKVNKKMYRSAMGSILSELVRQDRLVVVDQIELAEPKTRLLADKMSKLGATKALIVTEELDEKLYLAARNNISLNVCDVDSINPVSLVGNEKIVMTENALKRLQEKLS